MGDIVIALEDLKTLMQASRDVVNAVSYDLHGTPLPGYMAGGNGGLISVDTSKKCDALRRAITKLEPQMKEQ